jgi:DNA-directed RNA polymerase subunit H (RpoH/RPB5)
MSQMSDDWDDEDYDDEDELDTDNPDGILVDEDIVEDLEPGSSPFNQAYYMVNMTQQMMKAMMQHMQYLKHDLVDSHNWHISQEKFIGSVEAGLESLNIRDNKLPKLDKTNEVTSKPNKSSEEKKNGS